MTRLPLKKQTLRVIAVDSPCWFAPKQITWQCHVPQPKKLFACQIRIPP